MLVLEIKHEDVVLQATVVKMGADLLVAVTGGDQPHIGSASVSVPRPSLADPSKTSSTTSTINLLGHKDNIIGDIMSARLSAVLNTNVVVACGVHIDNLSPDGINQIITLTEELTEKILEAID